MWAGYVAQGAIIPQGINGGLIGVPIQEQPGAQLPPEASASSPMSQCEPDIVVIVPAWMRKAGNQQPTLLPGLPCQAA